MDKQTITTELNKLNQGRNTDCFPVIGFGWKDADLTPDGCTGIKEVVGVSKNTVVLKIGGHKTVVSGDCLQGLDWGTGWTDKEFYKLCDNFNEVATEIVCDCPLEGDWSGDDWSLYYENELSFNKNDKETIPEFCKHMINVCNNDLEENFCKLTTETDTQIEALYQEMKTTLGNDFKKNLDKEGLEVG